MKGETLSVRIGGRDYTLTSAESAEWTKRVADYVDRKINEVSMHTAMNREIAAVIAALSITEELFQAQQQNQALRNRLYLAETGAEDSPNQAGAGQ